ncbi:MAG TPA: NAD-dependent epimerase/dehydratase family protein, partial [Candidatus Latescibacteria bacterium]|nr:NAD-dependent epimerase/dehydratase family protein [Candidatus Latescibacterota bacterium]
MAQYLVTGGAGFIGSHLCRRLLADGHAVRVIDDLSSGQRDNLAEIIDEVELVVGDLRDEDLLDKVLRGVDYALHHAAVASVQTSVERPLFEQEVNAVGTLRFFEAARRAGVGRVVFAASAAAYGNNPTVPKREQMIPEPESPYAISKVMGEYYARVYSQIYGLQVVCLRYFNVFGPRQDPSSPYSGVISIFAERMLKGEAPVIFGDGGQSRDFVYVDNIVEANMRACTTPEAAGRVYNIGCERSVSILELVTALNEVLGTALDPVFNPARQGD